MGNGIKAIIPLGELVNIEEEKRKLQTEKEKLTFEVQRGEKMLSNPGFVNKAPKQKVEEEQKKLEQYKLKLEETIKRLENL